jgi:hypothetical protein
MNCVRQGREIARNDIFRPGMADKFSDYVVAVPNCVGIEHEVGFGYVFLRLAS